MRLHGKLPVTQQSVELWRYRSIVNSIKDVIQQPGILNLFNHWKDRNVPNGVMSDVYVGAVWKSFLFRNEQELLGSRYCLGGLV